MERILAQVSDITKLVTDIAAGAQEQATGLAEVNTAITQMDQATQQNASMVQESSAASNSLKLEAEQLVDLMAEFRLDLGRGNRSEETTPAPRDDRRTQIPMRHASAPDGCAETRPAGAVASGLRRENGGGAHRVCLARRTRLAGSREKLPALLFEAGRIGVRRITDQR